MRRLLLLLVLVCIATKVSAQQDEKYYSIADYYTELVDSYILKTTDNKSLRPMMYEADPVLQTLNNIMALGKRVYNVVQEGKPNLSSTHSTIRVVPVGTDTGNLVGWSNPNVRVYRVTFVNFYGVKVIQFLYRVYYVYNGRYQDKGQYLAGVEIVPSDISVLWGFYLNVNYSLVDIYNYGTIQNPVAGAVVQINYQVGGTIIPISLYDVTERYLIKGDGNFSELK